MKKLLLAAAISCASTAHAADSTLLRDIMGAKVFEDSGLTELSGPQLKVLEGWIVNNAVNNVTGNVVNKTADKPDAPVKGPSFVQKIAQKIIPQRNKDDNRTADTSSEDMSSTQAMSKTDTHNVEARYVRLADEATVQSEEEPATQKYVRIESLQEKDRYIEPDLIRSRIDGEFTGWRKNKTRFKLENGEVWQQRQASTYITNMNSPEVIIRKGRFGYTMEVPSAGQKVHVKRIK